ncbi:hypothetical protein FKP32DRAFT_1589233, partial [Trametes sanguinea]
MYSIDCLYGAPICPALCSFVVPKHQVEDAEGVIDKAGLEGMICPCDSPEVGSGPLVPHLIRPAPHVLLVLNISERSLFGLCIPWIMLLDRVYVYMLEYEVDGTPLGKALEDPGLAFLFKYMSARFMGRYTNEQLRRIAIKKSRYDLKPYILKQGSA